MFIKRENAIKAIDDYAQALYSENYSDMGKIADTCSVLLENVKEEYVVPIEQYHKLNFHCTVLKALLKGEYVKCDDVMEALNITFDQGMKMFEFGASGPWDDSNVRFRIGQKTLDQTKMKDFEKDFEVQETMFRAQINPDTHQLELVLEQQGGII